MLNSGPSGFQNAPLSKALLIISAAASVVVTVMNAKDRFNLPSLSLLTNRLQFWRLLSNHLFFSSPGEALFGLILIYSFRIFERQMGTPKFGAFTFLSYTISTLLQLGLLTIFPTKSLVSGPYAFIFSCFVLFYYTVPVTNRFRFLQIAMNDKVFTYLLGLQLLLTNTWASTLTGVCGIVSGLFYAGDVLRLRQFKLPEWVNRLCAALFLPLLQSPVTHRTRARANRNRVEINHNFARGGQQLHHENRQELPISEDNVTSLTSMGFSREMALQALQQANNDVQMATNLLLDSA